MKRFDHRILWGSLLILAGVLFMLQNLKIIPSAWGIIWGLFFGLAGGVFLYAFMTDRTQWWPVIPGITLLGLMVLVLADQFFPNFENMWGGSIFLGGIGLSFWVVYLVNREAWWAVIPAGVLTTLATIAILDSFVADSEWVFFIGLGLTFALVGILPTSQGRMTWAFIPAGVLLLLGLFTATPLVPLINYLWPVALILLGGYFIVRNIRA
ncbi:MAG: hypothetical protein ISS57_08575 [Anaerolineales bacterium]|nr:hypothetical protein [Anaerolineales bacterium]